MSSSIIIATGALGILIIFSFLRRIRSNTKGLPFPPGPPALPLIGNLFNMPSKDSAWVGFGALSEKYGEWPSRKYLTPLIRPCYSLGDVMHFRIMNQHVVVVSSLEAATELFERRGTVYSDRFLSVMMGDLCVLVYLVSSSFRLTSYHRMESGWAFSMISYNEEWRQKRKVFHQYLGANAILEYGEQQTEHVMEYLKRLRDSPEKALDHSRL